MTSPHPGGVSWRSLRPWREILFFCFQRAHRTDAERMWNPQMAQIDADGEAMGFLSFAELLIPSTDGTTLWYADAEESSKSKERSCRGRSSSRFGSGLFDYSRAHSPPACVGGERHERDHPSGWLRRRWSPTWVQLRPGSRIELHTLAPLSWGTRSFLVPFRWKIWILLSCRSKDEWTSIRSIPILRRRRRNKWRTKGNVMRYPFAHSRLTKSRAAIWKPKIEE